MKKKKSISLYTVIDLVLQLNENQHKIKFIYICLKTDVKSNLTKSIIDTLV